MKDPHTVIIAPHITEKSVAQSYGDPRVRDDKEQKRKYTFLVATDANKFEIKAALEAIYNAGKRAKDDLIVVESVRTVKVYGKSKRRGTRVAGRTSDRKKAIVTLAKGQLLEDYGV